jgi:hypothetical protein
MDGEGMRGERHFESEEMYNERGGFQTEQSRMTPETVATDWYGVHEMKEDAMDEAFGMAGRRGCEEMNRKVKSQFLDYNWA